MATKRAFISFDFDHDEELRDALVGPSETSRFAVPHRRPVRA